MKIETEKLELVQEIIKYHALYDNCCSIELSKQSSYLEYDTPGCGCCSSSHGVNLDDLKDFLEESELRVIGIKKLIELLKS